MALDSSAFLTRRKVLLSGAAAGGALLLAKGIAVAETLTAPLPCALTRELEEGPYYVDSELLRRDIRDGKQGLPLHLRITVLDKNTCKPLPHAAVDIWHCDAMGVYSGYEKQSLTPMGPPPGEGGPNGEPPRGMGGRAGGPPLDKDGKPLPPPEGFGGPGGPGGPPHSQITDTDRFCRGVQLTGADGVADFLTIYPGWYQGRDTHIHVKVHVGGKDVLGHDATLKDAKSNPERHVYRGGHVCFTGQMAFEDAFSDRVAKLEPYRTHDLQRTRWEEDGVFEGHANDVLLKLAQMETRLETGVTGSIVYVIDPAEVWKEQHGPGGRPPMR